LAKQAAASLSGSFLIQKLPQPRHRSPHATHQLGDTVFRELFHYFLCLLELLEQAVNFLHLKIFSDMRSFRLGRLPP
jgi:hypothetical protein